MSIRIITISRQYGSGGRHIGQQLAERLGIRYYDKILLEKVAQELGYTASYVEKAGEYGSGSGMGFIPLSPDTPAMRAVIHLPDDRVVSLQNELILKAAEESPCVIVGRAADYLLRERKDVLNVFVHASEEYRVHRMLNIYGLSSKEEAIKKMKTLDKQRAKHYRYYTDRHWGEMSNYHLAINTAVLSQKLCVDFLVSAFQDKKPPEEGIF